MTSKNTFFDHSHDFNIYGGEFTNVAGDQVIVSHNHHYNNQGSLGSAMVTASGNRYRSIPIGDMFIHRTISSTTMYIEAPGKDKDIPQHRLLNKPFLRLLKKPFLQSNASGNKKTFVLDPSLPQARVKVVRTVSSVQLIDFPASGNFTAITYDGPGAQKAFKNDLLFFSKSRTPSIAQLFGIVQDTLPALVFHTELVPLGYLLMQCSPVAVSYLYHRFRKDILEFNPPGFEFLLDLMPRQDLSWIQPSSGLMCIGPWGPSAVPDIPWTLDHQPFIPPLSFQDLKSSKRIIDHIESHLPGFLTFLAHSSFNPIVDVPLGTGISFETVYYQHSLMDTFIPIAHFHPMHKLSYSISHWRSGPDEYAPGRIYNQDSNGWTIVPYEKFNLRCSLIKRTCSDVERLEVLWLAQSGYICKETHYNLEDCYIFDASEFFLRVKSSQKLPSNNHHLFVAPLKVTEVGTRTYFSFNDPPYVWSSNPTTLEPLPMDDVLHLPSFVPGVKWALSSHIEHDAAAEYILSRGFDPLTQDYSRSQGYMLFEILSMAATEDHHF